MHQPLTILFLLEDLCYGGTQKQNLALAQRMDRKRFEPAILTLTGATDMDGAVGDVPLFHLGASRRVDKLFFARLPKFIKMMHPDVLVPCTALPNIWGRIWGRMLGVPLIVGTCRGGGAPARQHEWALCRLADGIVCNSPRLMETMRKRGMPDSCLRYIANGVDSSHFMMPARHIPGQLILCVARLAKDKDHKTLVDAFAMISGEFPEARLRLVGEGPELEALESHCAEKLAQDVCRRVEFAGASPDPAPHYQEADIFAMSSIREGQPNSILEAMSCGLPVCSTNVGGIPELVRDNGLLSEAGNAAAMAANLRRLLRDDALRKEMGKKGRQRVMADFSFDNMTARHEDFIMELWERRKCVKRR